MRTEPGRNNLTCARVRAKLPELAAGELEPPEAGPVRQHVAECAECRAELARLQAALEALHAVPAPEPPGGSAEKLVARSRGWVPAKARPWWLPTPALSMGAVASVLVGVMIVLILWQGGGPAGLVGPGPGRKIVGQKRQVAGVPSRQARQGVEQAGGKEEAVEVAPPAGATEPEATRTGGRRPVPAAAAVPQRTKTGGAAGTSAEPSRRRMAHEPQAKRERKGAGEVQLGGRSPIRPGADTGGATGPGPARETAPPSFAPVEHRAPVASEEGGVVGMGERGGGGGEQRVAPGDASGGTEGLGPSVRPKSLTVSPPRSTDRAVAVGGRPESSLPQGPAPGARVAAMGKPGEAARRPSSVPPGDKIARGARAPQPALSSAARPGSKALPAESEPRAHVLAGTPPIIKEVGPAAWMATDEFWQIRVSAPVALQAKVPGSLGVAIRGGAPVRHVTVRVMDERGGALGQPVSVAIIVPGRQADVSVPVVPPEAGEVEMRVVVQAGEPQWRTDIPLRMKVESPPERQKTGEVALVLREVPLRKAVAMIGAQAGFEVQVASELAELTVDADFSDPIPAETALSLLAEQVGGRLERTAEGFRLVSDQRGERDEE